ncbi:MAG: hypothetical protein LQ342_005741 [Letrouitia transgressa]|nr:MAG: hypothetical protein LQ342_005741 [Letrouitia transgressa]
MSVLPNTSLLQSLTLSHGSDSTSSVPAQKRRSGIVPLRARSSIAAVAQFVQSPVANVGELVEDWWDGSTKSERIKRQTLEEKKQVLHLRLQEAPRYAHWQALAIELDELEGNNDWKAMVDSTEYDTVLVKTRLKQLDEARISCDVGRMLFLIRTSFARGLGNMGNIKLYKHSHIGTKDLIEQYINSALDTIDSLLRVSERCKCDGLESKFILEQLLFTRQAYGRSALLLSGGATFGMNHIGVLKALWEARLLPRIISGASAGSIVCAVVCTRTDEDIPDLLENFCNGDLAVFEEEGNGNGPLGKIARFLKYGAVFDISHLKRVMKELLGEITFQEAYNRTRKILNICVSTASLYELPRLLNYITAPNVLIWSAVAASCSVPLVFSAATIFAKDPKSGEAVPWNPSPQRYIDGSVDNDLPMTRLAELFNVNHFIVSQVNPHVVPFLMKEEDSITKEAQQPHSTFSLGPSWLHNVTQLARDEALHRMHTMAEVGLFPNTLTKAISVLSQKYSGDITIFPEISYADFPRMLSNPSREFMRQAMLCGEKATWPKLSRIKNHCAIELALDEAVQKLRARVVFSPSQVDLRLGVHSRSHSDAKKPSRPKSTRSKRPVSQSSAPDAAPVDITRLIHTGKVMKSRSREKPQSVDILLNQSSDSTGQRSSFVASTSAPLEIPKNFANLTSSGAETSNLTSRSTSYSSLSETPPMESPFLSSTNNDKKLPLRISGSQPSTPSSSFFPPSSAFPFPTPSKQGTYKSPSTSVNSLSMTPKATIPSPTEPKPRRSPQNQSAKFSSSDKRSSSGHQSGRPGTGRSSIKGSWGLDFALPGARQIISRKKKAKD